LVSTQSATELAESRKNCLLEAKYAPIRIPENLIARLQPLGPHFIRVAKRGKEPIDKDWPRKPLFADDPKLQAWLREGGNYGVVGGFGLVIVDIDLPELKEVVRERLPPTFTVQSPGSGGWHLYYLCSLERPIRLRDKEGENIGDIQGPGKMVVGPGSIHPNGGVYRIIDDRPLAQVTREELVEAFKEYVVPDEEIARVESLARLERKETGVEIDITQVVPLERLRRSGDEFYGPHPIHGSSTGRNFWVNPSKNCWHCFRHGSGGGPLLWLAVEEGLIDCAEARPGVLRGDLFKKVLEVARRRGLIPEYKPNKETVKSLYFRDGRFIPKLLGDELMLAYPFITLWESGETYVWLDGYYQRGGEVFIEKECSIRLGEEYNHHRAEEVIHYIKAQSLVKFKEPPPELINLENGILDLKTGELKPHSSDYMFFNKVPVKYDPKADCPRIKKFLSEIVGSPSDVKVLEEIFGFCLYREYFISKAVMLVGEGENGKSTFLNLLKRFLGRKNVCSHDLHDFTTNRFSTADLRGKLANIYADVSNKTLRDTGKFKILTGGDPITAEHKYGRPFTFVNYAKLIFSANRVPETYDDSDAFFRRWLIIVFPNRFTEDKRDPFILNKLTTPQELSGLLNLALEGLKRLLKNGRFTDSKTIEEIREDYLRKSSPIASFVMDCLETSSEDYIEKKVLYNAFLDYCRKYNLPAPSQDTFYKKLPLYIHIEEYRPKIRGKRIRAFKGIKFTSSPSSGSKVSNVSKVFPYFKDPKPTREGKEKVIEKRVDRVDTVDMKLKVCGDCLYFRTIECPMVNPELISPAATYAADCPYFKARGEKE